MRSAGGTRANRGAQGPANEAIETFRPERQTPRLRCVRIGHRHDTDRRHSTRGPYRRGRLVRLRARLPTRLRGHSVEAPRVALRVRPIEPLAQDQEPEPPGRAAAARGGLEWLTSPGHSRKWSRRPNRRCANGSSAPRFTRDPAVENDFHADVILIEDRDGNGE